MSPNAISAMFDELQKANPNNFVDLFPEDGRASPARGEVTNARFPELPEEAHIVPILDSTTATYQPHFTDADDLLEALSQAVRALDPAALTASVTSATSPGGSGARGGSVPDALAWYMPRHFSRPNWGIYLTEHGIEHVAAVVIQGLLHRTPGSDVKDHLEAGITAAFKFLLRHEAFHFAVEMYATGIEVASPGRRTYLDYEKVYAAQRNTSDWVEELLADYWGIGEADERSPMHALRTLLLPLVANAPPGYRHAIDLLEHRYKYDERGTYAVLANHVVTGDTTPNTHPANGFFFTKPGRGIARHDAGQCPCYFVIDRAGLFARTLGARLATQRRFVRFR